MMIFEFWGIFIILAICIIICDRKFNMLRDASKAKPQPYSWSRVQLAWWSVIVLSSFITILLETGNVPTLNMSTIILLGISAATTATAKAIDVSDESNPRILRHQDQKASNFFLDLISDENGASISRLQALIFNVTFGIWFIATVITNIAHINDADFCSHLFAAGSTDLAKCEAIRRDYIMPVISQNNLILLGLSSATYAALKTTENKATPSIG